MDIWKNRLGVITVTLMLVGCAGKPVSVSDISAGYQPNRTFRSSEPLCGKSVVIEGEVVKLSNVFAKGERAFTLSDGSPEVRANPDYGAAILVTKNHDMPALHDHLRINGTVGCMELIPRESIIYKVIEFKRAVIK